MDQPWGQTALLKNFLDPVFLPEGLDLPDKFDLKTVFGSEALGIPAKLLPAVVGPLGEIENSDLWAKFTTLLVGFPFGSGLSGLGRRWPKAG